jgi:hypothetical protein
MAYEDSPFAIFRRFGQLNMLILLSLQAELMELQGQFKAVCKVDDDCSDPTSARRRFAYSFNAMRKKYNPETTIDPRDKTGNGYVSLMQAPAEIRQYGLILEIREKLKEYS